MAFGRQALDSGLLDTAAASQTRALIAIGASQVSGARAALAELAHLEPDPARVGPVDIDALSFRGVFHLLAGDLGQAISDLTRQPHAGAAGRDADPGPAGLLLPGAGPVPGRRVGRRAAHRRAGVLRRGDPLPPDRAAAAAPGRGLRAGQPRRGRGSRTARPAGRGGRGQHGLRAGTGVRGNGPGAGVPGGRGLPGHGRRAGGLAGRRGPGRPQPGLRRPVAAAAGGGPGRFGSAGAGRRRAGPAAGGQHPGELPAAGRGLAGRMAGRAARGGGRRAGDLRPR